ncbi:MAG: DUF4139 domain-containing protein [Crocinitomicaceae bacterium]
MKNLLILVILIHTSIFAEKQENIKSTIQSVTVYQQGAQIHRKAYYSIQKGLTTISIQNISRQIDPKSIQVNATGSMVILDSKYELKYPEPIPQGTITPTPKLDRELIILNDSIQLLGYEIVALQQKLDVLNTQKNILNNNGAIKGVGKVNDSIPLLKQAMAYYYEQMNNIHSESLLLTISKNKLLKTKVRISNRIQIIHAFKKNSNQKPNQNQEPISSIEITLSANANASGKLEISYMVSGAGWTPIYDIRSNSIKNNIDLTYKAQVYQNTGIDWLDAQLKLSTTNPYTNKTKPNLSPFYVNYYKNNIVTPVPAMREAKISSKRLEIVNEEVHADSDAYYEESLEKEISDQAFRYVQVNEHLISVEYEVNLPYSILSNNEKHLVLIRQESLKSNYKYYTVPKLDPSAYLVAELTDLDNLNLVPGVTNIFHDGTYIGETRINPSIMTDSLALSLGKDQNIQVKRTLLKKDSKIRVIGDKTIKTYAYLMEIKNHKSTSLNIVLQDQVPVTQNSEIEIEVIELSKGSLNEVTGFIDWNLKIKPKETKTIKLVYTVSSSKNKTINLVQN